MSADNARAELARAHALIRQQHAALEATLKVQGSLLKSVAEADEAFRALSNALNGAVQLLDQGRPAEARAVLATLAAVPIPDRLPFPPVQLPSLPADIEGYTA